LRSSAASALAALLVGVLVAAGRTAAASPLSDPTVGRAVFTGPVSPHPTSLELNPAALAIGLPGLHFYLSGSGVLDQVSIDRRLTLPDGTLTDGPSVSPQMMTWGSSFAAWVVKPTGFISSVGAAIVTTPADTYPASEDALRYHTLGGSYRELTVTIGGSIRLGSRVHIGAMFGLVPWQSLDLRYARDTALDDGRAGLDANCNGEPCGLENPAAAETYRIENAGGFEIFSADRIILSIGGMVQVARDWWVGASYRSPQGLGSALTLSGNLDVTRASIDPILSDPTAPDGIREPEGDVDVRVDLPQTFHLGVRGRVHAALDLVGGLRFDNLSRMREYDVRPLDRDFVGIPEWQPRPRGLDNVYSVNVGVEQVDSGQRLVFGGRLGVESAAVSAERISPMQVSGLVITADAGAQLRLLPQLVLQLGYGFGYYPEVDSNPSDYDPLAMVTCIENGFDYDSEACATVRDGYAIPTAAGRYRRFSHSTRLGIRYDF
jgi:hypothetical protein